METAELKSQTRSAAGKGAAKKLRAAGKIPAVLYGGGESLSLVVDARDFETVTHAKGSHVIVQLGIEGQKSRPTAMIKEIQRDPVRASVLHVDFQKIALDERIKTTVPLVVTGDAAGVKQGGILQHQLWELNVEALPKDLPEHVEIDVSALEIGDAFHVREIPVPEDVTIHDDLDEVVVSILPPVIEKAPVVEEEVEEVVEAPLAEEAAGEKPEERREEGRGE